MDARDLLAAATTRPWSIGTFGVIIATVPKINGVVCICSAEAHPSHDDANIDLIVAAVNEYEPLLDIAERLRELHWASGCACGPDGVHGYCVTAAKLARLDAVRSGT